jgi:hypothetical protein
MVSHTKHGYKLAELAAGRFMGGASDFTHKASTRPKAELPICRNLRHDRLKRCTEWRQRGSSA